MKAAVWAALALLAAGCNGRPRSLALDTRAGEAEQADESASPRGPNAGELVEIDLSSGVSESPSTGLFVPRPASRTYSGLIRELDRAAGSARTRGFFIRLGGSSLDWARSEELGAAFGKLREQMGKPVVCHAHSLDNRSAWFAARACSRVWVSPAGDVDTVGIAAQVLYLKGTLDKLKVRADFLHMGRYKSAAESLTQEGPSDEARESLTAVLASIRQTWMETTGAARKAPNLAVALEDGPFSPDDAKERGLVDAVGYEDEARKDAEKLASVQRTVARFGGKGADESPFDAAELLRILAGGESPTDRPHLAVLPAEGSIAMGAGGPFADAGITAKAMQRVVRRLAADDTVRAVVLRIDSPGGSALASDLLWHELMLLRKKKPLIASIGEMAASGGYYLACAANKVVAERTSIVGSIGVVGGKIVIDEALADLGVRAVTFPAKSSPGAASRASYQSPFAPWDDATRERVRKQMEQVYELFLRRVAEGRSLPVDSVRSVAEGRIWSGVQGQQLRLVDELGGLGRSIELARKLAGLDPDAPIRVEGAGETLLESLFMGEESADEATLKAALARRAERQQAFFDRVSAPLRPFVGALAPLLEGESTVAAMPFGFTVR